MPAPASEEERPVGLATTALAAALSCAAAGWLVGGVFRGTLLPRGVAVAGVVVGAGLAYVSHRMRRPFLQYLVLPLGALAGLGLMLPYARGGTATAPALIIEAVRQGGLAQPPVPFDPGWRFILVVVFSILAAAAVALAISNNRPKLGVLIPVPLAGLAALLQPADFEIIASVVGAVLVVAALGVAQGAELSRQSELTAGFEVRRLARGAGMIIGLIALLVLVSRTGVLFPQPTKERVIPPQRPLVPPPPPDQALFTVRTPVNVPFRFGVIDEYDSTQHAWLLPPFDLSRYHKVHAPAGLSSAPKAAGKTFQVSFTMDQATGHEIPTVGEAEQIKDLPPEVGDDARTATLRLTDERVSHGLHYTIVAAQPPSAKELQVAPVAGKDLDKFLEAPTPPQAVQKLLLEAPQGRFERLQYVRQALYSKVVAAGIGKPVDLPVSRVADMLAGKEATPYEITAAEALLARWAGVPARMGYGYYGGNKLSDGRMELRPKHGATWLEVYFNGYGWIPVVGVPKQAKASSQTQEKNQNPAITASHNLNLLVYVPTRTQTFLLYYEYVRYWVLVSLPFVVGIAALILFYPGAFKLARRYRRRIWGRQHGYTAQIACAYAEFRDVCRDLNIGSTAATPLEFLRYIESDPQHQELAWLVSRAWWGDVARDLRESDVRAADDLANSLIKRVVSEQTFLDRLLAISARSSLVEPYTREVPNLWWPVRGNRLPRRRPSSIRRWLLQRRAAVATP
jgi:hypothetical protein